jgi:hypothetical protein
MEAKVADDLDTWDMNGMIWMGYEWDIKSEDETGVSFKLIRGSNSIHDIEMHGRGGLTSDISPPPHHHNGISQALVESWIAMSYFQYLSTGAATAISHS